MRGKLSKSGLAVAVANFAGEDVQSLEAGWKPALRFRVWASGWGGLQATDANGSKPMYALRARHFATRKVSWRIPHGTRHLSTSKPRPDIRPLPESRVRGLLSNQGKQPPKTLHAGPTGDFATAKPGGSLWTRHTFSKGCWMNTIQGRADANLFW